MKVTSSILELLLLPLLLVVPPAAHPARGETLVVESARDNTLYEDAGGAASNGAGQHFFAGTTREGLLRRGLVRFDLSALPADAVVLDVVLQLHMSRTSGAASAVTLHPVAVNWGEGDSDAIGEEGSGITAAPGDATWIHTFFPDEFWTNPGGDFAAAPSAATVVAGPGFYTWSGAGLRRDLADWRSAPGTNHGWLLRGDEGVLNSAKRFDARENPDESLRPRLTVTYVRPAPADPASRRVRARPAAAQP